MEIELNANSKRLIKNAAIISMALLRSNVTNKLKSRNKRFNAVTSKYPTPILDIKTINSLNNKAPSLFFDGSELKISTTIISTSVHKIAIDKIVLNRYLLTELTLFIMRLWYFMQFVEYKNKWIAVHLLFPHYRSALFADHNFL